MEKVKAYVCGADFQHDIGRNDVTLYRSLDALKKAKNCWEQCGIVELEIENGSTWNITNATWVAPQDFFSKPRSNPPGGDGEKNGLTEQPDPTKPPGETI